MSRITAIRIQKGRGKKVNIFLDGKFAFNLKAEVALKEGLNIDQELSANQVEALTGSDHFHRCLDAAVHYLSYRPRSESEIRQRLHRRGFDNDSIEATIARLKEQGLVDDMAFAQFWKDNRQSFSPRSRWLTRSELRQKGVADDITDKVVVEVDDTDSAYRAALSKARSLSASDYQSFSRRVSEYLKRRGFGYEVINQTIGRLWRERV